MPSWLDPSPTHNGFAPFFLLAAPNPDPPSPCTGRPHRGRIPTRRPNPGDPMLEVKDSKLVVRSVDAAKELVVIANIGDDSLSLAGWSAKNMSSGKSSACFVFLAWA